MTLLKRLPLNFRLFVLMGISFGNRVIAHMLEGDSSFTHRYFIIFLMYFRLVVTHFRKPDGIIFGAYPLYGESDDDENNQKRRKPLFNISPNSKKIIFVSGILFSLSFIF